MDTVVLEIDTTKCQGQGRCYGLAPDLFDADDLGMSRVIQTPVPADREKAARLTVANCPEYAIRLIRTELE